MDGSLRTGSTILLVLKDGEGNLCFLVPPELSKLVTSRDYSYIQSLLRDFVARAKLDPASLFKQLSSLRVGPLVTQEVGSNIADHPILSSLCSRFMQL